MADDPYAGIVVEESPSPVADPPAPEAPGVEEPVPEPEPPAEDVPPPPADEPPPVPASVQARIDRITAQRHEAAREAAYWRAKAEGAAQAPPQAPADQAPREPREEDYERHGDYLAALVDFRVEQKLSAAQQQQAQHQQQAQQQHLVAQKHAAIQAREAELLAQHPDYYDRCGTVVRQVAPHVKWGLEMSGTHGPDLVLYLHEHPDAIARLNQVPPHQIGIELGLLRAGASTGEKTPARTAAASPPKPEPPTPVAGSGRTLNPETYREDMSQAEYEAYRRKTSSLYRRPG